MKETIRQRALELGFDDCRFTTGDGPGTADRFQNWLAGGRHGEMSWLERTAPKRVDPQKVLPGAKGIIVLAANYGTKVEGHDSERPLTRPSATLSPPGGERDGARGRSLSTLNHQLSTGFVARYARHTDYHTILGDQLKALTEFVNQLGGDGTRSLWYVDTGPLLERDFAQRAGLGFIGKHANVISRKFGNWILLGEIITTLELEPDAPEKNRCGKCARCIAACPTNAITAPFQLDARRCISYLTIELKGPIPVELRPAIGNRIFGCDECLAVCPWNRFAREGKLMKTHARLYQSVKNERAPSPLPSLPSQGERMPAKAGEGEISRALQMASNPGEIDLIELLQLDEAGFKSRFAGTPILRTKRRGLLRNVCVALGNLGDKSALPALQKAAKDSEPLIAEHARWAVDQIHGKQS